MKACTRTAFLAATVALTFLASLAHSAGNRSEQFQHSGRTQDEGGGDLSREQFTEAPTGFDNRTNGFSPQGPAFDTIDEDNVVPLRSFNDNRFIFEEVETKADGLGPTYNAQSCRECHQNVVTGGASQVAEHRTGRLRRGGRFLRIAWRLAYSFSRNESENRRDCFICGCDVSTFRISPTLLGAGFVECVADETLMAIRDAQPPELRGTALLVPVLEARG